MSLREDRKQQSHQALLDATLALSSQGRAFSTISLHEVAGIWQRIIAGTEEAQNIIQEYE